ncbi:flagellar export chaperone FliS [Paenibacillus glacialis]|uniref:Flagellar secretion chaperone FliS n=1 Tax=Paenibacillus glacialis TaxID=494026 RepID=A0A162MEB6_9BACL|nr:flagellar export chaperone FliS [Paenibacillus glacialis]OAB42943.1 flagellar export chaperone FliS [Paenibacillus glacialis]
MITSPYEKYKQSSVQTANPSQLLIMLYDGAIRFIRGGIESIGCQDYQKTNEQFKKAQTIVSELSATLDYSYEISKNLATLYEYINYLLIESNMKKVAGPAEEAIGHLSELREAWVQASKSNLMNHETANG